MWSKKFKPGFDAAFTGAVKIHGDIEIFVSLVFRLMDAFRTGKRMDSYSVPVQFSASINRPHQSQS
jgi:hypothetical protein